MDFLEGLNVGEDFLQKAAASQPTVSDFNRRYVLQCENVHFSLPNEKYIAKIADYDPANPPVQAVFEGRNAEKDKELTNHYTLSCGAGWKLDGPEGSKTAPKVMSEEYTAFSGQSGYGGLQAGLNRVWGLSPEIEQFFLKMDKETEKEYIMGPEAERFIRWYARQHQAYPDFREGAVWNGVYLQMDKHAGKTREGKDFETSKPIGIAKLEGESEEDFAWYKNRVEATGAQLPWYVLHPGQEWSDRVQPEDNGKPAGKQTAAPNSGGASKSAAKSEPAKSETKKADPAPAASAPAGAKSDEDILSELTVLAAEHQENPAEFRKLALQVVKGPAYAHWISKCAKPEFQAALLDGTAEIPAKKK